MSLGPEALKAQATFVGQVKHLHRKAGLSTKAFVETAMEP